MFGLKGKKKLALQVRGSPSNYINQMMKK